MSNQKNKGRIFIDYDGTAIDIKDKYYALYEKASLKFGLNIFGKKTYWQYKTKHRPEKDIILKNNRNSSQINKYLSDRLKCIEDKKYLAFDQLIADRNKLEKIAKSHDLYLVTMRQNKTNLLWELRKMKIHKYFKGIISREMLSKNQIKNCSELDQKKELLSRFSPFSPEDILIGDTELDHSAGKYFKLRTFIVSTGVCDKKTFLSRGTKRKNILYKNINDLLIRISNRDTI